MVDPIRVCRLLDATTVNLGNFDELRKLFPRMEKDTITDVLREVMQNEEEDSEALRDRMDQQMDCDEVFFIH